MPLECIYVFRNVIISGNTRGAPSLPHLFPAADICTRPPPRLRPARGSARGGTSVGILRNRDPHAARHFAFFLFFFFFFVVFRDSDPLDDRRRERLKKSSAPRGIHRTSERSRARCYRFLRARRIHAMTAPEDVREFVSAEPRDLRGKPFPVLSLDRAARYSPRSSVNASLTVTGCIFV